MSKIDLSGAAGSESIYPRDRARRLALYAELIAGSSRVASPAGTTSDDRAPSPIRYLSPGGASSRSDESRHTTRSRTAAQQFRRRSRSTTPDSSRRQGALPDVAHCRDIADRHVRADTGEERHEHLQSRRRKLFAAKTITLTQVQGEDPWRATGRIAL